MQIIEITDIAVARRCRLAQYSGRAANLTINGSNIHCFITSVMDVPSLSPASWAVTVKAVDRKPVLSWKPQANR